MQDKEYIEGALRTESPVTNPELVARFHNSAVFQEIIEKLNDSIAMGEDLDELKKYLFYGKVGAQFSTFAKLQSIPSNPISDSLQKRLTPQVLRLLHAALGVATEAAELFNQLYEHLMEDKPLDIVNVIEESGDVFWYQAILADACGTTFEDIKSRNNAKLRSRYPTKFTEQSAIERDLSKEREILEIQKS